MKKTKHAHGGKRPGAGKPRDPNKMVQLMIRADPGAVVVIKQLARARGITVSAWLRGAVLTAVLAQQGNLAADSPARA